MRRALIVLVALFGLVGVGTVVQPAVAGASASTTIYDSTLSPLPGNQPSQCFECAQAGQIGNQVAFAPGAARLLDNVTVSLSDWNCQTGGVYSGDCASAAGATFTTPITLNLYNVGNDGTSVGSLITSVTQTFAIPDRPTSTPGVGGCDNTQWYDAATGTCNHGLATNVTFNFGHTVLPDKLIYGIALTTTDYGTTPTGVPGGYDSLNVALSNGPPSPGIGSDPVANSIYWDTQTAGNYCDGGTAGTGTFRLDQGCWGQNGTGGSLAPYYVPAVKFTAVTNLQPAITSANAATVHKGVPFNFTVTTTGSPIPTIALIGTLPGGIVFHDNGNGTATISGTRLAPKANTYTFQLKAKSAIGKSLQNFTLTYATS